MKHCLMGDDKAIDVILQMMIISYNLWELYIYRHLHNFEKMKMTKIGYIESIVEEIADCYIMLNQLEVIFDLSQETINNAVQKKLKRLEDRIKETIHEAEMHGNFEPIDFDAPESIEDNNFLYNRFMKTE